MQLLLCFEIGLKCKEYLLNVGRHYAQQTHSVDLFEFACLLACFFELERVEGLIELVDFGLDL